MAARYQFEALRLKYRSKWDAYQVIAYGNVELLSTGQHPSNEQLIAEQRALEAVGLARAELLAAIPRPSQ